MTATMRLFRLVKVGESGGGGGNFGREGSQLAGFQERILWKPAWGWFEALTCAKDFEKA